METIFAELDRLRIVSESQGARLEEQEQRIARLISLVGDPPTPPQRQAGDVVVVF